jgi:predicted transcriptional regulator YheO
MNHLTVRQYSALVSFLGEVLGPDYEIALHDLSGKTNSIVAIAHGNISGRTIGAPLTAKTLELLAERRFEQTDFITNYSGLSNDGKPLRSSSLFIKDGDGEPIGMLCINFDDSRFTEIATNVLKLCHPDEFVERTIATVHLASANEDPSERFPNSITAVTESVINEAVSNKGVTVERMTQEEKMEIIDILHRKGVFMLKGAVSHVAAVLMSSEASIYRYLGKLGKTKK